MVGNISTGEHMNVHCALDYQIVAQVLACVKVDRHACVGNIILISVISVSQPGLLTRKCTPSICIYPKATHSSHTTRSLVLDSLLECFRHLCNNSSTSPLRPLGGSRHIFTTVCKITIV